MKEPRDFWIAPSEDSEVKIVYTDKKKSIYIGNDIIHVREVLDDGNTIRLFKDGDQWCALIGEDLQEGVAGFGKTFTEALIALANLIA